MDFKVAEKFEKDTWLADAKERLSDVKGEGTAGFQGSFKEGGSAAFQGVSVGFRGL